MNTLRCLAWIFVSSAVVGCSTDDAPFLALDQLCPAVAEQVCEARRGCCDDGSGAMDCEKQVRVACDVERAALTAEAARSYDGESAEATRDALGEIVRACEPPFALSEFFEGGAALGAGCERDSACASGSCDDDGKCAKAVLAPLCAADKQ